MKAERFDEYHKHGSNFYGKLVVVDYTEDMKRDPSWGKFGAGVVFDYVEKARKLVLEKGYNVVRECLAIPDYVCVVE